MFAVGGFDVKRRLSAILFYDVVGYSRLMHENESVTIEAIKSNRKAIIDPQAELYNGRTIQVLGDGGFMEFASAVDATRFAIAMQAAVVERNLGQPEEQRLVFRIGINIGDVGVDGDLIYGDGVNMASRLEGLAEPGGICIHRSVRNQVRGKLDLDFEDLGDVQVKETEPPVRAFNVILNDKASSIATGLAEAASISVHKSPMRKPLVRQIAAMVALVFAVLGALLWTQFHSPPVVLASIERMSFPLPDKPSVAVLPFINISDDRSQELFADGMTEDLITDLSKISGLFVISRNSTFVYKNQSVNIAKVAEELGVRYVLEGSVRRAGDQMRVNAQLIDATTGGHVWAERYDGPVADIFTVQDQFIRKIAKALAVELTVEEQEEIALGQTANLSAREVFQKGWENYLSYSAKDNAMAINQFKSAVDLDPEYGRAYAALGLAYLRGCQLRWNKPLGVSTGVANAMALNYLSETKTRPSTLANVAASRINLYNNRYDAAQSEAVLAVAKDPNDPEGYVAMAWAMITTGQPEAGLELMERATRLNPSYPSYYILAIGMAHLSLDDLESAAKVFADALERDPGATELAAVLAATYAQLGRLDEAHAAMRVWKPEASQRELQSAPYLYHFPYDWLQRPEIVTRIVSGLILASLPPGDHVADLILTLREATKTDRVRAAQILGYFGPRAAEAIPALIDALDDGVLTVRKEAAISLGKIGPAATAAIPALSSMVDERIVGYRAKKAIQQISGD
jgi:adenylate cyclase